MILITIYTCSDPISKFSLHAEILKVETSIDEFQEDTIQPIGDNISHSMPTSLSPSSCLSWCVHCRAHRMDPSH